MSDQGWGQGWQPDRMSQFWDPFVSGSGTYGGQGAGPAGGLPMVGGVGQVGGYSGQDYLASMPAPFVGPQDVPDPRYMPNPQDVPDRRPDDEMDVDPVVSGRAVVDEFESFLAGAWFTSDGFVMDTSPDTADVVSLAHDGWSSLRAGGGRDAGAVSRAAGAVAGRRHRRVAWSVGAGPAAPHGDGRGRAGWCCHRGRGGCVRWRGTPAGHCRGDGRGGAGRRGVCADRVRAGGAGWGGAANAVGTQPRPCDRPILPAGRGPGPHRRGSGRDRRARGGGLQHRGAERGEGSGLSAGVQRCRRHGPGLVVGGQTAGRR